MGKLQENDNFFPIKRYRDDVAQRKRLNKTVAPAPVFKPNKPYVD